MSQPPLQDTAAAQCDVADAAKGGDGGIPSEINGVCAESCRPGWYEVGGGIRLPVWNNGAVTASVTASVTPNQTTTCVSRLGVVQAF